MEKAWAQHKNIQNTFHADQIAFMPDLVKMVNRKVTKI